MLSGTDCHRHAQAQEISLNYHCKCEQFVHFASGGFFNFNGTAGTSSCPTLLLQDLLLTLKSSWLLRLRSPRIDEA